MTKSKSRKDVLFEEAAKLFVEKGYAATSVRGIAERVGIEPSSIYSHIKSKEVLLVKICMDAAHYFVDGMEDILKKQLPVFDTIEMLVDLHIDAIVEAPTTVTVFTDEWKHLPSEVLNEFLTLRNGYELKWRAILQQGIDGGKIRKVDTQLMAHTLLSTMRWVQTWVNDEKVKRTEEIKSMLKTFIRKGLEELDNG
jgi:AcrR family transcriptional regulator